MSNTTTANSTKPIYKAIEAAMNNLNEAKNEIDSFQLSPKKRIAELETAVKDLSSEKKILEDEIEKKRLELSDLQDLYTETQDDLLLNVYTSNRGEGGVAKNTEQDGSSFLHNNNDDDDDNMEEEELEVFANIEEEELEGFAVTTPPTRMHDVVTTTKHGTNATATSESPGGCDAFYFGDAAREGFSLQNELDGASSASTSTYASSSFKKPLRVNKKAHNHSPKKWRRMIRSRRLQSIFLKAN